MSTRTPGFDDFAGAVMSSSDGSLIDVWAVPGASKTELAGLHDGALRIRVAAPPEKDKANRALEKALATATGADVELVRGRGSRRKRFLVKDRSREEVIGLISGQSR
jgi:uncharacterized protein (TIGR00251 family)